MTTEKRLEKVTTAWKLSKLEQFVNKNVSEEANQGVEWKDLTNGSAFVTISFVQYVVV